MLQLKNRKMDKFRILYIQSILDDKCTELNKNRVNSSLPDSEIDGEIKFLTQMSNDLTEMFNEYRDLKDFAHMHGID